MTGCPWKAVKPLRAKDETGSCQNKWPDRTQEELEVEESSDTGALHKGWAMKTNTPAGWNPTLSPTTAWLGIILRHSHLIITTQRSELCHCIDLQWQTLLNYKTKEVFGAHPDLNDVRVWFVWLVQSICIEYSTFHWAINDIFTIEKWKKTYLESQNQWLQNE